MKKSLLFSLVAGAAMTMTMASCDSANGKVNLTNDVDSLSYYQGLLGGNSFKEAIASKAYEQLDGIEADGFLKGFKEALAADSTQKSYFFGLMEGYRIAQSVEQSRKEGGIDTNLKLVYDGYVKGLKGDSAELSTTIMEARNNAQALYAKIQKAAQEKKDAVKEQTPEAMGNKGAGEKFLKQKAADPAVKKTASGLMYKVIKEGAGATAQPTDSIALKYIGKKVDGSVFDSSNDKAVNMNIQQVIPGFKEAVMLMNKGAHYEFYIPYKLAYGVNAPEAIGPCSTLVFDIEITDMKPAAKTVKLSAPTSANK